MSMGMMGGGTPLGGMKPTTMVKPPEYSRFGNMLAQMGNNKFKVLNPGQLAGMTPDQIAKYDEQRSAAKKTGTGDLLYALGTAFKGGDIGAAVQGLRDNRIAAQDRDRKIAEEERIARQREADEKIRAEMSDLMAKGDYDGAMAAGARLSGAAGTQATLQNLARQQTNARADKQAGLGTIVPGTDGQLIERVVTDPDGTQRKVYEQNPEAIKVQNTIRANKPLGASQAQAQVEDIGNLGQIQGLIEDSNMFLDQIRGQDGEIGTEDDELRFGIKAGLGRLVAKTGMGDQEGLANFQSFERFKSKLTSDILNQQTGTKTDFDFQVAARQLEAANTPEAVERVLKDLQKNLLRDQKKITQGIMTRNPNYDVTQLPGYVPFTVD